MNDDVGENVEPLGVLAKAATQADPHAAASVKVAADLATRLIGPSVDVLGAHWAEGLKRVLRKADARADTSAPGYVSARVAAPVLEAAQYADQEIVAEYFSGVLASSRTPTGSDDSGVSWAALLARLSSEQIRMHYLIYAGIRSAVLEDAGVTQAVDLHHKGFLLDLETFHSSFFFDDAEARNDETIGADRLSESLDVLHREGLIGENYRLGMNDFVQQVLRRPAAVPFTMMMHVRCSIHGIRLFLWAMGEGRHSTDLFLDSNRTLEPVDELTGMTIPAGAITDES